MPIKHQSDSFRNRKGIKYICWCDCSEEESREMLKEIRAKGWKCFREHQDGYYRLFVQEPYVGFVKAAMALARPAPNGARYDEGEGGRTE